MNAGPTIRLRVMIAEDEAIIALDLANMIGDLGHDVVKMANRIDAAMAFAASGELDLAILDMNLCGQLSFPIATILRARGIPFIFASGYGTRGLIDGFADALVLTKPYSSDALAQMVAVSQA